MSDIELRPSLREYFRAIISERLPELRNYITPRKQGFYEAPLPSPIRVIGVGFIFGIRVYCLSKSLKDVIKVLENSRGTVLLESHVFKVGEGFLGVFVLVTERERSIWKIAGEVADIDGVEMVEVLKSKKPYTKIFVNSFSYPPYLSEKRASIIPFDKILRIISGLKENEVEKLAEELANDVLQVIKTVLEPELAAQLLEALGLAHISGITSINNDIVVKIKHFGNVKSCLFYRHLLESLTKKNTSMIRDEEVCLINIST